MAANEYIKYQHSLWVNQGGVINAGNLILINKYKRVVKPKQALH